MTPLQIAKAQCANYRYDLCSGVMIQDDGSLVRFRPEGQRCLLADDQRCEYFEQCVLGSTAGFDSPAYAKEFSEAAHRYRRDNNLNSLSRKCPDCGRPLQPRKQLCPECAEKRQKLSNSKRVRKEESKGT